MYATGVSMKDGNRCVVTTATDLNAFTPLGTESATTLASRGHLSYTRLQIRSHLVPRSSRKLSGCIPDSHPFPDSLQYCQISTNIWVSLRCKARRKFRRKVWLWSHEFFYFFFSFKQMKQNFIVKDRPSFLKICYESSEISLFCFVVTKITRKQ